MPAHVSLLEEGRGSVDGHADEETACSSMSISTDKFIN